MKLVLRDRHSTVERLKKEYKTLLRIPDHPNVVKVIDADFLPGNGPPFIVFEYVDGLDVGEMIDGSLFAPEDALELARQVASGLVHLHRERRLPLRHQAPQPAVDRARREDHRLQRLGPSATSNGHGGGSRRYLRRTSTSRRCRRRASSRTATSTRSASRSTRR